MKSLHYVTLIVGCAALLSACSDDFLMGDKVNNNSVVAVDHSVRLDDALVISERMFPTTRGDEVECRIITSPNTRSEVQDTIAYILNQPNNGGYIVVSGDNRMKPILAFSETGRFEYKESMDDPLYAVVVSRFKPYHDKCVSDPALKDFTGYEILDSEETRGPTIDSIRTRRVVRYIGTGLSNSWDQSSSAGYGYYVRLDHPNNLVGCVAIAAGQLMVHGKNSLTYQGRTYDFSSLRSRLAHPASQNDSIQAIDEVARLLYDVSAGVHTSYPSAGGPGTAFSAQAYQLLSNLNYDIAQNTYQNTYNKDEMISYLQEGYFLYVRGYYSDTPEGTDSGHAFVCDKRATSTYGYVSGLTGEFIRIISVTDFLHFDFGWGGNCNGYFENDLFSVQHYGQNWIHGMKYFAVKKAS